MSDKQTFDSLAKVIDANDTIKLREILEQHNSTIDFCCTRFGSVLQSAVKTKNIDLEIIKLLIQYGADPVEQESTIFPLSIALGMFVFNRVTIFFDIFFL